MTTSNSRRQPPVLHIAPPPEEYPVVVNRPQSKWWMRFTEWAWEFMTARDDLPSGEKLNFDVLYMADNYRCGMCGAHLAFEEIRNEAELALTRYAIGECIKIGCRRQNIRIKVPIQVLRDCDFA